MRQKEVKKRFVSLIKKSFKKNLVKIFSFFHFKFEKNKTQIITTKLQWNAKSKIGSLENANHRPGGGDKKILTIKTDFKENAKPKVGSLVINANNNNNIETADNATAAATANE